MEERAGDHGDYMMLLDLDKSPISDNYGIDIQNILYDGNEVVTVDETEYMVVKHVGKTGVDYRDFKTYQFPPKTNHGRSECHVDVR